MSNPQPFNMPVGNKLRIERVSFYSGFRTEEQFEVVRKIVKDNNFAFSCQENLFTPDEECSKYTGPFCFYWYDKNHVCRLTRIGKRGKILAEH